ncbi:hypothetical protein [Propionivibrio dicarboxylicus]|uniref:Uncharacterized protein n=1 Tax=Propionivibrio dicarboxylicus TaxID=83767 RepID=A0A1G8EVD2_9RHOO|nr:hypothetical protein [Propionivibrio dicarboxylicus]SDH73669.1 hypothetical protein SAMN05660652_02199 [Propionivibrio dicarboxylicus]
MPPCPPNLAKRFPFAASWIKQQLAETTFPPSFLMRAVDLYEQKRLAQNLHAPDASALAGAYGGILKTWQAALVEVITTDIITELKIDPGRQRIKDLQKEIFGRAQQSKDLKRYAVAIRHGGGRAAPMPEVPTDLKDEAREMFERHRDLLKAEVERSC